MPSYEYCKTDYLVQNLYFKLISSFLYSKHIKTEIMEIIII